jgi:hypothetical protein
MSRGGRQLYRPVPVSPQNFMVAASVPSGSMPHSRAGLDDDEQLVIDRGSNWAVECSLRTIAQPFGPQRDTHLACCRSLEKFLRLLR